ncbi:MAG: hypothetical protein Q7Q71_05085 [Verrucomicrobiota bacterium JB023]|nr:hypothetical protein [Verrucomicrobiota bacterium JB023]
MTKFALFIPLSIAALFGAETLIRVDASRGCAFIGELQEEIRYNQNGNNVGALAVSRIMAHSGLKPNFRVAAADVPNACAVIEGNERLILYNEAWMRELTESTQTDWSAYAILAHEVGHHLQGHTLTNEGSRPHLELESDTYTGFVLKNMGASLAESLAVFQTLPDVETATHPARSRRLVAVTEGWNRAQRLAGEHEQTTPAARQSFSQFHGRVGRLEAIFSLAWHDQGSVSGSYYYPAWGKEKTYHLIGSTQPDGQLYLEEFYQSKITARCHLTQRGEGANRRWEGTMYNTDGRIFPMSFSSGAPARQPAARTNGQGEQNAKSAISHGQGFVGKLDASFSLTIDEAGKVSGSYYYPARGREKTYRLDGEISSGNLMILREYTGSELSAICELSKVRQGSQEVWRGTMKNLDGRQFQMGFSF